MRKSSVLLTLGVLCSAGLLSTAAHADVSSSTGNTPAKHSASTPTPRSVDYDWRGISMTLSDSVLTISGGTLNTTGMDDKTGSLLATLGDAAASVTKIVFTAPLILTGNGTDFLSNLPNLVLINGMEQLNTSGVTNMGGWFYNDPKLKSLDVSKFDTANVTNMNSMFCNATSLTSLDLSNFNTSKVTNMANVFKGDGGLTSLDLSNFDTSNVKSMEWMFYGTSALTSLDVSNFDTSNVTSMSSMFQGAKSLTRLSLGAKTKLFNNTYLALPITPDGVYTGEWQTLGTGTTHLPTGGWTGKTVDLITRSGTGVADTYVAKVNHKYEFAANDLTVSAGAVDSLDILKASQASLKDNNFPDDKFTVRVLDDGGLTAKAGTYTVILTASEVPSQTKEITVTVKDTAYSFSANNITVSSDAVGKLDILKASKASFKDTNSPDDKYTVTVVDKGGLSSKVGTYKVKLGVKEVPSETKEITVKVTAVTPSVKYAPMYRLYNKNTGEHFYTESAFERDSLVKGGWSNEGTGWTAPDKGTAVYRVYNPNAKGGDHYYTASKFEADSLVKGGWKWDNGGKPVFYSGGKTKVYVAFNPNAKASGSHNYTSNSFEQQSLLKSGWTYGKVQFYGK